MKLRQTYEDFVVEELGVLLPSSAPGPYRLYLLEKRGLETFGLINYLSRDNRIPSKDIGLAGLKDRHAITRQHVTIPAGHGIETIEERSFKLAFLGYVDRPLGLGDLAGNRFRITVRDLPEGELDGIRQRAGELSAGVPNYFDSQRFGSAVRGELLARHAVRGDYEAAVKLFLTGWTKSETATTKRDKRALMDAWPNLKGVEVGNKLLASVAREHAHSGSWLDAYKKIPHNLREIQMSAYQSHIWNECAKRLLEDVLPRERLYRVEYQLGELLFYRGAAEAELAALPAALKTVSHKLAPSSELERRLVARVLAKEGIALADLDKRKETGYFFKVYDRPVLVRPVGFKLGAPEEDELNSVRRDGKGEEVGRRNEDENVRGGEGVKGKDDGKKRGGAMEKARYKVRLDFSLPKGSYATIIVKKVFERGKQLKK